MLLTTSFLYDFLAIAAALIVCFITFAKWRLNHWKRKGLYNKETTFLLGNASKALQLKQTFGEMFEEQYKAIKSRNLPHGGAFFLLEPFYVPTDLNIVKAIIQNDFQHFVNHGTFINETGDPLSAHLFALEDDKWKNMRVKLTPTFTSGKMKMMFQTLADCSVGLKEILDEYSQSRQPLDIKSVLQRFTIDIICSCAFGLESNTMKNPQSEFNIKGKLLFEPNFKNSMRNLAIFAIPHYLLHLVDMKVIDESCSAFFLDVLRKTVNYRESNNVHRKDFMHLLIQLKNRGKVADDGKLFDDSSKTTDQLTFNEIAAQAFVFFIAGYEASSTAMTFALYELAQRPDLQKKMREEIEEVMTKHNGQLSYDAIKDMTYMDQVINESLRKYPPVPVLVRQCTKDYTVPDTGVNLSKGTKVCISTYGIHHDPDYYPNPEAFDPDRFSEEEKSKRPAMAWLPFGEGPRLCIGLRFGMMQAKVGLFTLLRNYDITLNSQTEVPLKFNPRSFIMMAQGGVWINVQKRQ